MKKLIDLKLPNATPTLYGKDAVNFMNRIEDGLKNSAGLIPTPKLHLAVKLIKEHLKNKSISNKIMELKNCKYCGKKPSSRKCNLSSHGTILQAWVTECEIDEDQEKFPFAEHRITVYGADKDEAENRWNIVNS